LNSRKGVQLPTFIIVLLMGQLGCNLFSSDPSSISEADNPSTDDPTALPDDKPAGDSLYYLLITKDGEGAPSTDDPTALPDDKPAGDSLYYLLITKDGEGAIVITNQSPEPFPISELSFSNVKDGVLEINWGIENLGTGDCIVIWKQTGNALPPSEDRFNLVADVPVKPPIFWGQMIIVIFDGEKIGECNKKQKQNECLFQFEVEDN